MEKTNINDELSTFGKYQKFILLLAGTISIFTAMPIFSTVFTAAYPDLICSRLNDSIREENSCQIWNELESNRNDSNYECKFDTSYYGKTIITEWNLVCNKEYLASLTQTLYLIGTFSSIFVGYLSDNYGRKKITNIFLFAYLIIQLIAQFLQFQFIGLSPIAQYAVYSISQFTSGVIMIGIFTVVYTLIMELIPADRSTWVSNFFFLMYVIGELVIGIVSYFLRDWFMINWFIVCFSFTILVLSLLFLPESPKYLMGQKKNNELELMIRKIAKFNGKVLPVGEIDIVHDKDEMIKEKKETEEDESKTVEEMESDKTTIVNIIFRTKGELKKIFFISIIWFSLAMTYFGVSLGITRVGKIDPYLIYTLSSISEFIGYLMCYINDKFGLKRSFIWFLGIACLTCLAVSGIQYIKDSSYGSNNNLKTLLLIFFTCVGKAFASAAFNSAYIYTSKMFSTRVRSTCLQFVSCTGRLGSVISPQINLLGDLVYKQIPYLIFSFVSFLGCIFIFILPDPSLLNNF